MSKNRINTIIDSVFYNKKCQIIKKLTHTKNACYIVECEFKKFFIKITDKNSISREIKTIEFFKNNNIVNVPKLYFSGIDYIISEFVEGLIEYEHKDLVKEICSFHKKSLMVVNTSNIINDSIFKVFTREKTKRKITEYRDYITEIGNINEIIILLDSMPPIEFNCFPKIVCHGDLHRGNIYSNHGEAVFLDEEFAAYSEPTFDISRFIISSQSDYMELTIGLYLQEMKNTLMMKFGETTLVRAILIDLLSQVISRMVSFRKNGYNDPMTKKRIKRLKQLVTIIFDKSR